MYIYFWFSFSYLAFSFVAFFFPLHDHLLIKFKFLMTMLRPNFFFVFMTSSVL